MTTAKVLKAFTYAMYVVIGIMLVFALTGCSTPDDGVVIDKWWSEVDHTAICETWKADKDGMAATFANMIEASSLNPDNAHVSAIKVFEVLEVNCD